MGCAEALRLQSKATKEFVRGRVRRNCPRNRKFATCIEKSERKAERGDREIGATLGQHQRPERGLALCRDYNGDIERETRGDRERDAERERMQ